MKTCDDLQDRLAEAGVALLQSDAEAREHLAGCDDCAKVLADLERLDAALGDLPLPDAPDALVADTLDAVRRAARPEQSADWSGGGWRLAGGALAATVVLIASLVVTRNYLSTVGGFPANQRPPEILEAELKDRLVGGDDLDRRIAARRGAEVSLDEVAEAARPLAESVSETGQLTEAPALRKQEDTLHFSLADDFVGHRESREEADRLNEESRLIARLRSGPGSRETASGRASGLELGESLLPAKKAATAAPDEKAKADGALGERDLYRADQPVETRHGAKTPAEVGASGGLVAGPEIELEGTYQDDRAEPREPESSKEFEPRDSLIAEQNRALPRQSKERAGGRSAGFYDGEFGTLASNLEAQPRLLARNYLNQIDTLDSLIFQEARGYWANTYIPGDPAMRLLRMRLRDWDRSVLGPDLRLEQGARQVGLPFDAPGQGALALYLHADRAAIEGATRLRLQVGLKGAERHGGHRPAMNVGLVVDGASLAEDGMARRIRALIAALERARQPGDRFSLTVAGPNGGLVVPPEQFRHGPLKVALEQIHESLHAAAAAPQVRLLDAVALAAESVRRDDDPNAVLGSSLVLLVTGSALAGDLAPLERLAHDNAVGGVQLSVVGLSAGVNPAEVDRLVAAGQGNRRILEAPAEADALIDRELHAASRAVARAVRLRIRLAPGVELVDVLGSRRLEEPQAERVREAEQAIDRRLARNLGIEADRGEDEDGIQIVIPNFFAGDSHVVLLDLVAEGPGPIADVQVRYKDVVRLDNGVAEAALALDGGAATASPLERSVLKNLMAWQLAGEIRRIGWLLEVGDAQTAVLLLARQRDLIQGLRIEVPGWSGDPDLAADAAMLEEYLTVLAGPAAGEPEQRRYLAQSLRYAAFSKLQSAAR